MFLYNDIGKKIKTLAIISFIVEAAASIISGIVLPLIFLLDGDGLGWLYFLLIPFGPIVAWVGSWTLYAFGELVDKVCDIEKNTRGNIPNNSTETPSSPSTTESPTEQQQAKDSFLQKRKEYQEQKKEAKLRQKEILAAQQEAVDLAKHGIAPTAKVNRFGEASCPMCGATIDCGDRSGMQKCPHCKNSIKIIR